MLNPVKVVGKKQTLKAVKEGKATKVYVATDAERSVVSQIISECRASGIEIISNETMESLGKKAGIDVKAAVIAELNDVKA